MRRVAAVTFVLALVGVAGAAWAAPDPPSLSPAIEVLMRRELAGELSPREIDRLLREPRVRAALASLFDGWDGVADELRIERNSARELVVQTFIRERRCLAHLELGPEVKPIEPVCDEAVRVGGERSLALGDALWRPVHAKRPVRVAAVAPAPEPVPEPDGPVDNTVLRRPTSPAATDLGPVLVARAEHEGLRDALRRPHWHDPLLPGDAVLAGEALSPLTSPAPAPEARVLTNLRNPFGDGRLRTADPVPDMLTLANDPQGEPLLPALREECVEEWRLRTKTPEAPTLDCYRRVAWHGRLEDDDAYQALSRIASILQLPLLDTIVALQIRQATSHQAHRLAWALVWIAWVHEHPERMSEALAGLTPEERRFIRRRLADWWVEAKLGELRPTITRLFERHLLGLYPEATDLDGLPLRAFVSDTWLWANNWLAILDGRSPQAITAAYARLSQPERELIAAFVRDRALIRRWARAADVIAAL